MALESVTRYATRLREVRSFPFADGERRCVILSEDEAEKVAAAVLALCAVARAAHGLRHVCAMARFPHDYERIYDAAVKALEEA